MKVIENLQFKIEDLSRKSNRAPVIARRISRNARADERKKKGEVASGGRRGKVKEKPRPPTSSRAENPFHKYYQRVD